MIPTSPGLPEPKSVTVKCLFVNSNFFFREKHCKTDFEDESAHADLKSQEVFGTKIKSVFAAAMGEKLCKQKKQTNAQARILRAKIWDVRGKDDANKKQNDDLK